MTPNSYAFPTFSMISTRTSLGSSSEHRLSVAPGINSITTVCRLISTGKGDTDIRWRGYGELHLCSAERRGGKEPGAISFFRDIVPGYPGRLKGSLADMMEFEGKGGKPQTFVDHRLFPSPIIHPRAWIMLFFVREINASASYPWNISEYPS